MKRRTFIRSIAAFFTLPKITPVIQSENIIYAPYIPIIKYRSIEELLMFNMCRDIQLEIDEEVLHGSVVER